MDAQAVVYLMRGLVQLGISVDQYQKAVDNPDMSDEELAEHIKSNTSELEALRDKEH